MSETGTFDPIRQIPPRQTQVVAANAPTPSLPPLISSSSATQATAAGSAAIALATVTIIVWILGLWHVDVPATVATAMATLIGVGVHAIGLKMFMPTGK